MRMSAYVRVCARVLPYMRVNLSLFIYLNTRVRACVCAYVYASAFLSVRRRACARACVSACVCACLRMVVRATAFGSFIRQFIGFFRNGRV